MKQLLKHPLFIFGNLFYLFILLGFILYTYPNKMVFGKYSWHYFGVLLLAFALWLPYNFVFIFPLLLSSLQVKIFNRSVYIGKYTRCFLILLFWLFLVALIFVSTELYLRMSPKANVEDFHPFLQALNTKKNESAWHVNSDGFRYDEMTKEKPKDTYRIFVTGGSTVFDEYQPYEKTLVKQLENMLRKHYPDRKLQVINTGYLRYTSEHTLILYATKLSDYDPDLVVVWQGFNDLYYSCAPPYLSTGVYKNDYSHFYAVLANVVNSYFNYQTHLYTPELLSSTFNERFYADLKPYLWFQITNPFSKPPQQTKPVARDFPSLSAFTRNMDQLVKLIKSDNVNGLLGNQPNMYNKENTGYFGLARTYCTYNGTYPSNDSFIKGMKDFNEASRKVAEENYVPFVDLDTRVPKSPEFMYDDVHYTLKGDTLIAKILYEEILKHHYLDNNL